MWCETKASAPRSRQNVFFSSAPQPSTGSRGLDGQRDRLRGVPAGTADRVRPPAHHPQHRVVGAGADRAVVQQRRVGDRAEPGRGVVVPVRDRLVRDVPAGQHDRRGDGVEQQVVQAGVGQQQPQVRVAGRHRGRHRRARPPSQQHDRGPPRGQLGLLGRVDRAQLARRGHARHQHRERLVLPVLAGPQRADRVLVGGQRGQVVAAEALHRDHGPAEQRGRGRRRSGPPVAGAIVGEPPATPGRTATAGRSRGSRSAARGTGGRPGRGTPPRRPGTSGTRASSWCPGRRARR